eukprot:c4130_g1_i1 orf=3-248(-)
MDVAQSSTCKQASCITLVHGLSGQVVQVQIGESSMRVTEVLSRLGFPNNGQYTVCPLEIGPSPIRPLPPSVPLLPGKLYLLR